MPNVHVENPMFGVLEGYIMERFRKEGVEFENEYEMVDFIKDNKKNKISFSFGGQQGEIWYNGKQICHWKIYTDTDFLKLISNIHLSFHSVNVPSV